MPLIHMEMWLWLLERDFELKKIGRIKLLDPNKMSLVCQELQKPDAAERFVELVGPLTAELQDAKLILLPVWGDNPEHWTFLKVVKGEEGKLTAEYKDSLSGVVKANKENAERLTTLLSAALMQDIKFPEERSNVKFQPKGSLECGFFVCHWVEQSIREELGEGPFPIGLPNVRRVYERLESFQNNIIKKNKGWAALHKEKAAKAKTNWRRRKLRKPKCWQRL